MLTGLNNHFSQSIHQNQNQNQNLMYNLYDVSLRNNLVNSALDDHTDNKHPLF